jgi:PAS domain S-box-containing protein
MAIMCTIERDGRLVWWNPAFNELLGCSDDEIAQGRMADFVHPADLEVTLSMIPKLIAGDDLIGFVNRVRSRDATWRWIEWRARADASGTVYAAGRDITVGRRTEVALRDTEVRLQTILDHAALSISVKDLEGRYVFVNGPWLRLCGLDSEDQVLGRDMRSLWEGRLPNLENMERLDRALLETGESSTTYEAVVTAGGTRNLLMQRFLLSDADGNPTGTCTLASDISERTQAQEGLAERERLLAGVIKASPDIVSIFNADGSIRQVSEAARRLLGYERNVSVSEMSLRIHPQDADRVVRAFTDLLCARSSRLNLQYRVRHAEGHWVDLDSRGQLLVDDEGTVTGAVIVSRDVTTALATEEQLRAAVAVAEAANKAKSEFLSRMSHELRTPLNSVLGFAQLLEMDNLLPAQSEAVDYILRAGRHLRYLIDEVLDMSQIEAGHLGLSFEAVFVAGVLREAAAFTAPLAASAGVTLHVPNLEDEEDLVVRADRQRLMQVLLNLLSNATKYNRPAGRIALFASRTVDGSIRVAVSDTGVGIDPALADRVFEPFDRLGAERTTTEGSGVGLALCRHLVEQMGGTIGFESSPGEGSCFWIDLPAAARPAGEFPEPRVPESAPARELPDISASPGNNRLLRVLHIEDNLVNHALVDRILALYGTVELLTALDGNSGLDLARQHIPDIILLDLHLPDLDGSIVLEGLRSDPRTSRIPVVVVSADATLQQSEGLLEGGAAAYLTKPIEVQALLATMSRLGVPGPTGEPPPVR